MCLRSDERPGGTVEGSPSSDLKDRPDPADTCRMRFRWQTSVLLTLLVAVAIFAAFYRPSSAQEVEREVRPEYQSPTASQLASAWAAISPPRGFHRLTPLLVAGDGTRSLPGALPVRTLDVRVVRPLAERTDQRLNLGAEGIPDVDGPLLAAPRAPRRADREVRYRGDDRPRPALHIQRNRSSSREARQAARDYHNARPHQTSAPRDTASVSRRRLSRATRTLDSRTCRPRRSPRQS
jgi:hypothetical protein